MSYRLEEKIWLPSEEVDEGPCRLAWVSKDMSGLAYSTWMYLGSRPRDFCNTRSVIYESDHTGMQKLLRSGARISCPLVKSCSPAPDAWPENSFSVVVHTKPGK